MIEFNGLFFFGVFILGLLLGSFYNVCIYRYFEKTSVIWPASHCPVCKHSLSAWENIPVLSYIILRGKCRWCKIKISFRYPLVELLTGLICLALAYKYGFSLKLLIYMIICSILIIVSFIDFQAYLLPDKYTYPGAIFVLASSFFTIGWKDALIGALVGAGLFLAVQQIFLLVRKKEGLGSGDIKLMLMLGGITGPIGLGPMMLIAALSALVASVFYKPSEEHGGSVAVPFGPFLSFGAISYILWFELILQKFLG